MRLVENNDDISFLRVINEPSRKIGKVLISKIEEYAQVHDLKLYDALKEMVDNKIVTKESAIDFVSLIQTAKSKQYILSISDLLEYLLIKSGYDASLRFDADEERLENLEELKHSIKYYEDANVNEDISLTTFLQDISLYTNADEDMSSNVVKLMTIHQAKGLEFPYVFIINLFEGGLPNFRNIGLRDRAGLEEERRLMYVATTRAEKALFLTDSEGYDFVSHGKKIPSRFLREIQRNMFVTEGKIDESLWKKTDKVIKKFEKSLNNIGESNFKKNQLVQHKAFGIGKIISIFKNGTCKVKFGNNITRTLKMSFIEAINATKALKPIKRVRTLDDIEDETLFKMLMEWRKNAAKEIGVADFAILREAVLHDLATFKPTDEESLLSIKGIGPIKYVTYGDIICKLIMEYIEQNEKKN